MEAFTIKGNHPVMEKVLGIAHKVASTDSTVLILGESGTGKSLVARYIHASSKRASKPLIAVECGALLPELAESEMFGHEEGAFTGAVAARVGLVQLANDGTIFLDEVHQMPPPLQVRFSRVLQSQEIRPVGGRTIKVDVRVIAASSLDLGREAEEGRFCKELFVASRSCRW